MNKVEVSRSFSYKLNIGNYQTADFFCSQKAEVPEEEAEKKSEQLYEFCRNEVIKSVNKYQQEEAVRLANKVKKLWDEKKQELYNNESQLTDVKTELAETK